jgi:hypothetical protein
MKMKWMFLAVFVAIGLYFSVVHVAHAQEPGHPLDPTDLKESVNLFAWFDETNPDWGRGALYAALGFAGSLATIFTIIGGAIPGSPGQARIDADQLRMENLYERLEVMIDDAPAQAPMVNALEATVNNLRDDLRKERWRQFFFAALIYAAGGSFFATALAIDMFQAVVVGAGWTGVLGAVGVRSDSLFRHTVKDAAIDKLSVRMRTLTNTPAVVAEMGGQERIDSLMREAKLARGLTPRRRV